METVASADGTEIAFERTGSGPPLVLVHPGGGNDHTRWELAGVRPALAERFTVYAMDCRGRGRSGDAEEYELEREFEDVAAVVDSIDEPAALLGHSLGALYSLEAALRTDDLRRLVLYDPPITVGERELIPEAVFDDMKALMDDGENEEALLLFLRQVASPEEIEGLRAAPNWRDRVDVVHTVYRERHVLEYEFDPDRFANLTVPTLLLTGSESPPFFRAAIEAVDDALPNSRLVTFDGHGHVAMLTATDRFIDEVVAFVGDAN